MMSTESIEIEDVGEAIREKRPLRPAHTYTFRLAQENLDFRVAQVADPVPLGRQILAGAGLPVSPDISLIAILASGDFEDVRLDELFDLRGRGVERFIAFRSDREFKFTLNDRQLVWGKPFISGVILRKLGDIGQDQDLLLQVRGAPDRLIGTQDLVDLAAPGVEHLFTVKKEPALWEITVNSRQEFVPSMTVTFEQLVQLAYPGASPEANVRYSVTYRHVASQPHAGELAAGGSVRVKRQGSIFNVARTVQS